MRDDREPGKPIAAKLDALLFAVCAVASGAYFYWVWIVERHTFERGPLILPCVLLTAAIFYYYVGGRSWIERRKPWPTRLGIVAVYALLFGPLGLALLLPLLLFYVLCRFAAARLQPEQRAPQLWRPGARVAVAMVLFLGVFPAANHLFILRGIFFHLGAAQPPVMMENRFYRVNEERYRGPLLPEIGGEAGRSRILFLGDSVTWGFPYREEDAYPRLVESELRRRGVAVDAVNLGIPAQSLVQIAAKLDRYLAFEPDTVFLMTGKHYRKSIAHARAIERFRGPWLDLDHEWTFTPPFFQELVQIGFVTWKQGLQGPDGDPLESPAPNLARYRATLVEFAEGVQAAGARVVLLEFPGLYLPGIEITELHEELAEAMPLEHLPLRHLFTKEDQYALGDTIHPDRDGHRRIAREIAASFPAEAP